MLFQPTYPGYSCPICTEVILSGVRCDLHPDSLVDIYLNDSFTIGRGSEDGPYDVFERLNPKQTRQICQTEDEETAERIAASMVACAEIPSCALERGYIQTLQEIAILADAYLKNPNNLNQATLKTRLEDLQFRSRQNQ